MTYLRLQCRLVAVSPKCRAAVARIHMTSDLHSGQVEGD